MKEYYLTDALERHTITSEKKEMLLKKRMEMSADRRV